jgi:hypothetical protein
VCSKWHELLADASVWPVVDLTRRGVHEEHPSKHHAMDVWLRRFGAGIRELILRVSVCRCSCRCADMILQC